MSLSPSASALEQYLEQKTIHPSTLEERIASWRSEGETIATINGSFDLLHAGHLHILYEASLQGTRLLVALNSDNSIKSYKGPSRPIIPLKGRLQMVAALAFVHAVTWFDEGTPIALLERVRPDVHVNGAEYGVDCLEAATVRQYGGKVHIVPLIPNLSTSNILKTIDAFSHPV
jgi:rfaE bifunctional protein nucleotidyltransferase chain/domain